MTPDVNQTDDRTALWVFPAHCSASDWIVRKHYKTGDMTSLFRFATTDYQTYTSVLDLFGIADAFEALVLDENAVVSDAVVAFASTEESADMRYAASLFDIPEIPNGELHIHAFRMRHHDGPVFMTAWYSMDTAPNNVNPSPCRCHTRILMRIKPVPGIEYQINNDDDVETTLRRHRVITDAGDTVSVLKRSGQDVAV
jgi:hypothetical protein